MLAAPVSVVVVDAFAAMSIVWPVWLVNVTPWFAAVHPATSEVIVPLPETAVTRTANGFGLLTWSLTFPFVPGYRLAVVVAETSEVVSAAAVPALAYPEPEPLVVHAAYTKPTAAMAIKAMDPAMKLRLLKNLTGDSPFPNRWFRP